MRMLSDTDPDSDHFNPTLRVLEIAKQDVDCGFQLTRSKWDPYPWVSSVDDGSAAQTAGLAPGDCLLEVNGEDVVGKRVSEIAELVKSQSNSVSLLLWNAGVSSHCTPETLCCGPMPKNLQRLSAAMASVLRFLECPVCLDSVSAPTYQCDNGHLICRICRSKTDKCPVCRMRLGRCRCLLAEQIYNVLVNTFEVQEDRTKLQQIFKTQRKNKKVPDIKVTHTDKFFSKFLEKSTSLENLTSNFGNKLKTKSLSTNEICSTSSPIASRTGSVQRLNSNLLTIGSFDALPTDQFFCPFSQECSILSRGSDIFEHFKSNHTGPLIQYFGQNVTLSLTNFINYPSKYLTCVIQHDRKAFFLNLCRINDTNTEADTLFWLWCLAVKKVASDYFSEIHIAAEDEPDQIIMRLRLNVHSLSDISWSDMIGAKKATFISGKTISALKSASTSNLVLNVSILKDM